MFARVRARWTDPAVWRDLAYLGGLFPVLWALDLAVVTIWLAVIGLVTLPAWYWAPEQQFAGGRTYHGVQFGYFPHGPHGPGAVGFFVDTLPKAIIAAVVFARRACSSSTWSCAPRGCTHGSAAPCSGLTATRSPRRRRYSPGRARSARCRPSTQVTPSLTRG